MDTVEAFRGQVRDALKHFHDPIHFHTHPLRKLAPETPGATSQSAALRQMLVDAIEALRPTAAVPSDGPEWLGYLIMRRRYLEALPLQEICSELGVSRASLYRHHRDALDALTNILWERVESGVDEARVGEPHQDLDLSPAQQEASRLARAVPGRSADVRKIAEGVRLVIGPLAAKRSVELQIDVPETALLAYGDITMLRQSLVNVFSEVLHMTQDGQLDCSVRSAGEAIAWRISAPCLSLDPAALHERSGFAVAQSLLSVFGGEVRLDNRGSKVDVTVIMAACRAKTLLAIDDEGETLRLYRQYLSDQEWVFVEARTANEAREAIALGHPDLILLDVLMPGEDGWLLLQRLKTMPDTAGIPVVICSVLTQPDLALALGAAAVLQKPVTRTDLVSLVTQILTQDSPS